jgi:hypothetical protein
MRRRNFALGLTAILGPHRRLFAARRATLAAAWQVGAGYQVGLLQQAVDGALQVACALDVPTRAHGLLHEAGGSLLTVARRPGDWLLRWDRTGHALAWRWIEARRAFSGHVLGSADGRRLYTTEMDLDSGAGLVGVRDAASLEKLAEWPTHGIDAHELIWAGTVKRRLLIANGGVPTHPDTGRGKRDLARMDSSLVELDCRSGELTGQWRLDDRRLSLRHLAWDGSAGGSLLGVALQAEHDETELKADAPALALFDGRALRAVAAPVPLGGYGGDIAALAGVFAVSCPRAQGVALHGADGSWRGLVPLAEACALVATEGEIWAGGLRAASTWRTSQVPTPAATVAIAHAIPDIRLDNHWVAI